MTEQEYLRTFIKTMEKLEGTFARGFAPIINSMYRAAATEIDHGNLSTPDLVVDRYSKREREFIQKRYMRTAEVFGKLARSVFDTKKSYSVKEPLSPEYWMEMEKWARLLAARKVTMIDTTTKKAIAAIVFKGLREGNGTRVIAKELRKIGVISSRTRSNLIARTETHNAANKAAKTMAVDNLGANEKKWLDAGDKRVRANHRNVEGGEWIFHMDNFSVGGESLEYPGDPSGSARNVCNCRCSVMYRVRRYQ